MRLKDAIVAVLLLTWPTISCADPLDDALNLQKTKNPLATLFRNQHGCDLISPPELQFLDNHNPAGASPGDITIPKIQSDGKTWDLSGGGSMCPVPKITDGFPEEIKSLDSSVTTSISYKNDITASLKLTMGSWLKLIDFDASNIQEVGIWITTAASRAFAPNLNHAAEDIKLKWGKYCPAFSQPDKARIVDRSCVGKITISLVAKKDMSLNAFDFQLANLTVGLKASWNREVVGAASDCTVDASGIATSTTPASTGAAKDGDPKTSSPALQLKDSKGNALVTISEGAIDKVFQDTKPAVVGAPTKDQVASVAKKPATDQPAPKPVQEAAKDKVCAKNVIYQTTGLQVVGVNLLPAKQYINFANGQ